MKITVEPIDNDVTYELLFHAFKNWAIPYEYTKGMTNNQIQEWYKNYMDTIANKILNELGVQK